MSDSARKQLVQCTRRFYERGWMLGTAGNVSLKDGESFWISASGKSKGALTESDFLRMDLTGDILERATPQARPSAEASIHKAVYHAVPAAAACFHVHTLESNWLTHLRTEKALPLPPLEMLKGFGLRESGQSAAVDVFENHADVPRIASDVEERFRSQPPVVPGFIIRDHGLTVWGASVEQAVNHLELFDYIFRFMVGRSTI